MTPSTRRGRGSTPRPSHLQLLDASTEHRTPPVPLLRRTQSDVEAARKARNVLRMIMAGYISPDEGLPWIDLELGVGS